MDGGFPALVWMGPGERAEIPYESVGYLRRRAGGAEVPSVIWAWDLPGGLVREAAALLEWEEGTVRPLRGEDGVPSHTEAGDVVLFSSLRLRTVCDLLADGPPVPEVFPEDLDLDRVRIGDELRRLHDLTVKLRAECPWDKEQTQASIVTYTVEEVYELVDAIGAGGNGNAEGIRGELGDLLFQVYFLTRVAEEDGLYDLGDVAAGIREKLIERHPHVFGTGCAETSGQVRETWDQIKKRSEGREGIFHDVPEASPAPLLARKLQERAASVGFDWREAEDALPKIREEWEELLDSLRGGEGERRDELGDLLFAVINLGRKLGIDPELALRGSAHRFRMRVEKAAGLAENEGNDFSELDLEAKESYYRRAKDALSDPGGDPESG